MGFTPPRRLVEACLNGNELYLTFDRAVDAAGVVPSDVVVRDGNEGVEWGGTPEITPPGRQTPPGICTDGHTLERMHPSRPTGLPGETSQPGKLG